MKFVKKGETTEANGQVLVFVNSRRRCERLVTQLKDLGFRSAFYHAGLDFEDRHTCSSKMKNHDIDVLIATSSLEMG
jgi:superfamily II helicase